MQIGLANQRHVAEVVAFFNEHLDGSDRAVYSEEFVCSLGIRAAILRKQMIVATVHDEVVGACRFYRKKTQNTISLYQFAVREDYRGKGLMQKMLHTIQDVPIVALCPLDSGLNDYYQKTNWSLQQQDDVYSVWTLNT